MERTAAHRFTRTRDYTIQLCVPLSAEDYIPQPVEFVSPPKWHLGHTTWFFEEFILTKHLKEYVPFNQSFGYVFNSYYNTIGDRILRTNRGNLSRPTLEEVLAYRKHVDKKMGELLQSGVTDAVHKLLEIGINHEQQHQELLITDLKFILGANPLEPSYSQDIALVNTKANNADWIHIEKGLYDIGASGNNFTYDNEHGRHTVYLAAYAIKSSLVSNAEFIHFIEDGGYERHELWLDEGWAWVNQNAIEAPLYWQKDQKGVWSHYTLAGRVPVDPKMEVSHVSHYEAAAFAEWSGHRLPTESEWEVASEQFQWGTRWEHTNSAYLAYPGFKKPDGAVGEYNGKFMMNQMVLRGASVATSKGHSRKTYRNFFHPQMQWQYSGIRLVKNG